MNPENIFERRRFLKEGGVALLTTAGLLAASASNASATQLSPIAQAQGMIVLRSPDGTVAIFQPAADTDAARGTALREAIAAAVDGDTIEITIGRCAVTSTIPLSDSLSSGVTDVKIFFGVGAAVVYGDPEDAREDSGLFAGDTRNVLNFGAVDDIFVTSTGAFQAANNALPIATNQVLASGREHRTGILYVPCGRYIIDDTIWISPTVHVRGAGCLGSISGCIIYLKAGSFTNASVPQFMFEFEVMVGVDANNHFSSQFTGLVLSGLSDNAGGCGLKIGGAQGCLVDNAFIGPFAIMGASISGPSIGTLWIAGIGRGPGLYWGEGGSAKFLSVEHINDGAEIDPVTSEPYPAIQISGFYGYHVGYMAFEATGADPHFLRIDPGFGVNINQIMMGTAGATSFDGVGVRITGDSRGVNIGGIRVIGPNPGVIVKDDSSNSPAGAQNLYTFDINDVGYSHSDYRLLGGKYDDNGWFGANRFVAPTESTALELGGNALTTGNRFASLDFLYDSAFAYRITPVLNSNVDWRLEFRDNTDAVMARFHPSKLLQVLNGLQSDQGYVVMGGPSNPTTSDIPNGFKQTWRNTTTGEVRDWTNIGGTLLKSAAYT